MFPNWLTVEVSITQILKSDKDTTRKEKKKLQTNIFL